MKKIEGGVCAAKGYKAGGVHCGIRMNTTKKDLALIISDKEASAAAVYTQNLVKGAPIAVTKENIKNGKAKAIICNSGNANTCNANGIEIAEQMCELTEIYTGISKKDVVVASTGVIGQPLDITPIANGMEALVASLGYDNSHDAAAAIMTTDTVQKEVAVEFLLDGKKCRLGGMAKGSGMIHPNMATTLNFITTDVAISGEMIQAALSEIVKVTYNCLSIDGDTSTNDMVSVMANGLAGNAEITEKNADFDLFKKALYVVMENMTKMLAADGEGASKFLECSCDGAPDQETAIVVAKSVIRSPLFKCAMFGEDANWGRILCAIGYAEAEFDIDKVAVELESEVGTVAVCKNGAGVAFSEEEAAKILNKDEIYIHVHLNQGEASAKAWGCDLTYDYVKINGDYRS